MRVELVPTTREHVDALLAEPLPFRVKAITGKIGDRLLGFGGLAFFTNGSISAFVVLTEEARRYPIALHRAARLTMAEARKYKRIVAMADPNQKAAERWLLRLGFRPFEFEGQKVFQWCSRISYTD